MFMNRVISSVDSLNSNLAHHNHSSRWKILSKSVQRISKIYHRQISVSRLSDWNAHHAFDDVNCANLRYFDLNTGRTYRDNTETILKRHWDDTAIRSRHHSGMQEGSSELQFRGGQSSLICLVSRVIGVIIIIMSVRWVSLASVWVDLILFPAGFIIFKYI